MEAGVGGELEGKAGPLLGALADGALAVAGDDERALGPRFGKGVEGVADERLAREGDEGLGEAGAGLAEALTTARRKDDCLHARSGGREPGTRRPS